MLEMQNNSITNREMFYVDTVKYNYWLTIDGRWNGRIGWMVELMGQSA